MYHQGLTIKGFYESVASRVGKISTIVLDEEDGGEK